MARLFFDAISKRFGDVTALHELTLDIADREFFVLLGPSGCGKTTALRIAAGLEEPSTGELHIGDRIVTDVSAKERDVAMVFQNYALYPHMSVFDNVAFGLRMRNHSRQEIETLVREAAGRLGIDKLLERKPGELSGGQQQRVALGRAIVRRPQAFLMDEPLSNLDSKMRAQMRTELIRLHRELGGTFLYVTHDQLEAMTMGTRVAVMSEGLLQQVGPPQEVYDRPANRFVAEFIGSPTMNFLSGARAVEDGADGLRAAASFVALPEALSRAIDASGAGEVVVGVRPEHLVPAEDGVTFAATFDGEVELVESLGSEQHVMVAIDGGSLVTRLPASSVLASGANVRLGVASEHLHVFAGETGARIEA